MSGLFSLAGPVVALFAIYAVHRLTQVRDREKSVYDLHENISDAAAALTAIVMVGWEEKSNAKRIAAIAQSKWRLQQLGGLVERLRLRSRRLRGCLALPPWKIDTVTLTSEMGALRDAITGDTFDDPSRAPVRNKGEEVEQIVGTFLLSLDAAILSWMSGA